MKLPWPTGMIKPAHFRRYGRRHKRRGATLVEMAIATPVLFLVLLGLFQFGYVFMVQHLLQNAAREACRKAVTPNQTNDTVTLGVQTSLQSQGIASASTTLLVNGAAGNIAQAKPGDAISVRILLPVSSVIIVPNNYLGGALNAHCVRRVE